MKFKILSQERNNILSKEQGTFNDFKKTCPVPPKNYHRIERKKSTALGRQAQVSFHIFYFNFLLYTRLISYSEH